MSAAGECDNVWSKCRMQEAIDRLYAARVAGGGDGVLGGIAFEDAETFFEPWKGVLDQIPDFDPDSVPGEEEVLAWAAMSECDMGVLTIREDQPVVCIGDVHGDLLAVLGALRVAELIDDDASWVGGSTVVLFLGDLHDRQGREDLSVNTSRNPREQIDIVQYLYGLDVFAQSAGGRVITMVGNHEEWQFQLAETGSNRHRYFDADYEGYGAGKYTTFFGARTPMSAFYAARCPCIVTQRVLVGDGPTTVQHGPVFAVHGGIVPSAARVLGEGTTEDKVRRFNAILCRKLMEPVRTETGSALYDHTVSELLNTRSWWENLSQNKLDVIGRAMSVENPRAIVLVVGHTIQERGIVARCSGRVWGIDVALSEAFGKHRPSQVLRFTLETSVPHFCVLTSTDAHATSKCWPLD